MILRRGDIVFVEITEVDNENPSHIQKKSRPALVIQKIDNPNNSVITLIPFTKIKEAIRYKPSLDVMRSVKNGLDCDSVLLILQMAAYDKSQITGYLGQLEESYMIETDKLIKSFLGY